MTSTPRFWPAVLAVVAASVSGPAHADCAAPTDYWLTVSGSTVTIAPMNFWSRGCPDQDGMLRQSVSSKEIVRLADFCSAKDAGTQASYVDECVPPGDYRYGFAKPYDCAPSSCGTYFFQVATVSATLSPTCQRSAMNAGPAQAAGAPWADNRMICGYDDMVEAGVRTDAAPGTTPHAGGCSTTPRGTAAVLTVDGLFLLAGLFALLWSRRSRA